jgi:hypothetical protein
VNLENKFTSGKGIVEARPSTLSVQSAEPAIPAGQETPKGPNASGAAPNAELAAAEWNKARQEMQRGRGLINAR